MLKIEASGRGTRMFMDGLAEDLANEALYALITIGNELHKMHKKASEEKDVPTTNHLYVLSLRMALEGRTESEIIDTLGEIIQEQQGG